MKQRHFCTPRSKRAQIDDVGSFGPGDVMPPGVVMVLIGWRERMILVIRDGGVLGGCGWMGGLIDGREDVL